MKYIIIQGNPTTPLGLGHKILSPYFKFYFIPEQPDNPALDMLPICRTEHDSNNEKLSFSIYFLKVHVSLRNC